jgi:transcriptional regulator with XRE-family HTH domain
MITREELMKTEEYWLETIQNEIYRMFAGYIEKENITQNQIAQKLGVSKGYISQIMNGNFNYTLKKLIQLSLAAGKVPIIEFRPLDEIMKGTKTKTALNQDLKLYKVAEPKVRYKKV